MESRGYWLGGSTGIRLLYFSIFTLKDQGEWIKRECRSYCQVSPGSPYVHWKAILFVQEVLSIVYIIFA